VHDRGEACPHNKCFVRPTSVFSPRLRLHYQTAASTGAYVWVAKPVIAVQFLPVAAPRTSDSPCEFTRPTLCVWVPYFHSIPSSNKCSIVVQYGIFFLKVNQEAIGGGGGSVLYFCHTPQIRVEHSFLDVFLVLFFVAWSWVIIVSQIEIAKPTTRQPGPPSTTPPPPGHSHVAPRPWSIYIHRFTHPPRRSELLVSSCRADTFTVRNILKLGALPTIFCLFSRCVSE